MKRTDKRVYESPTTEVLEVGIKRVLCQSDQMLSIEDPTDLERDSYDLDSYNPFL